MRTYSLLKQRGHNANAKLTVPAEISRMCEEAGVREFTCELTEDGILYRPLKRDEQKVPGWLKNGEVLDGRYARP